MRNFTPEEKELIANTPITIDCFDFENHDRYAMKLGSSIFCRTPGI